MLSEKLQSEKQVLLKRAKEARNKAYYEKVKRNKQVCEICCCDVFSAYMPKHLETSKHKKFEALREQIRAEEASKGKRGRKSKITKV